MAKVDKSAAGSDPKIDEDEHRCVAIARGGFHCGLVRGPTVFLAQKLEFREGSVCGPKRKGLRIIASPCDDSNDGDAAKCAKNSEAEVVEKAAKKGSKIRKLKP